ncbi:hypothetical protein [Streptomyces niveus]
MTNFAQITWPSAPVWLAGMGLVALLVLVLLASYIVRVVVQKARPEDLPAVLVGMSQVLQAMAGMLPWGRPRPDSEGLAAGQTDSVPETSEPRTVAGSVVVVQTGLPLPPVTLPATTREERR